ncbi:hypothetical protein ACFXKC_46205 [Streptomyces sp. NPDC059340]|uniref:hypothetical protein n=1 Tax=Streptomyces sp. NPDC059340 TaxID=3346806 RepID=UPI0036CCD3D3
MGDPISIDVSTRGPLFDGRARRVANAYVNRLERKIAEEGVVIVREELGKVLQHPTGYYESRITVEREHIVTDGGVVYGPWLAGVGSRNFPATRFRGYPHWIRARLRLRERKQGIAERLLRQYVGRM